MLTLHLIYALQAKSHCGHTGPGMQPLNRIQTLSMCNICLQIISKYGWTGLYRGLEPALLGTAISQGVYFYFYSSLR